MFMGLPTLFNVFGSAWGLKFPDLELVVDPGGFHDAVGCVPRLALFVDRHATIPFCPHFMRAFTRSQKDPAPLPQLVFDVLFVPIHAWAAWSAS